jgi:hypothetical protein
MVQLVSCVMTHPDPTWLERHGTPELEMAMRIVRNGVTPILILHGLCVANREAERLIDIAVADCRREGRSWAEIGDAMGITRQAARRRFMHLDGDGD